MGAHVMAREMSPRPRGSRYVPPADIQATDLRAILALSGRGNLEAKQSTLR